MRARKDDLNRVKRDVVELVEEFRGIEYCFSSVNSALAMKWT